MASVKMASCKPAPIYLITEKVYHLIGVGKVTVNGINVGIDAGKVYRQVHQACFPQDRYINGINVGDNAPSGWQYIKELFGAITIKRRIRPNAKIVPVMVYSGGTNLVSALGWKNKKLPIPELMKYGKDPTPKVKLFGNAKIKFHNPGGIGTPMAMIIYDPNNKKEPIYQVPAKDQKNVMRTFKIKAERFRQTISVN